MSRQPPEITLSARAAVALGERFAPYGETFCDPAVVRDVLRTFADAEEPLVLRVAGAAAHESIAGDWFCAADGTPPARLPPPSWHDDVDCTVWARTQSSWLGAWETCPRADWMLHAAVSAGVNLRLVVPAAGACARTALEFVPPREDSPARAIEAALAWTRGEYDPAEHDRARGDLDRYLIRGGAPGSPEIMATHAAMSTIDLAVGDGGFSPWDSQGFADNASFAACYAGGAFMRARSESLEDSLRRMVHLVRQHLSVVDVLRAAASGFEAHVEHPEPTTRRVIPGT